MPLSAGDKPRSYEILGPLGTSGMGEVYRARDSRLARNVALKILPADVANDPLAPSPVPVRNAGRRGAESSQYRFRTTSATDISSAS